MRKSGVIRAENISKCVGILLTNFTRLVEVDENVLLFSSSRAS